MQKKYKCQTCGFAWVPMGERKPIKCPNCSSKQIMDAKKHYKDVLSTEDIDLVE